MTPTASPAHPTARAALPILVLTLVWGCNWPVLKMGVTELAPLTFRSLTLPLAALGLLLVARASGDSIRVPRALWPKLIVLALFNIGGWNGFVLFGVQQLPAGRSAILAYTMPIWATLIAAIVLHERLSSRKLVGLALGVAGMSFLIGEQISVVRAAPSGALLILAAAITWAMGTVLLRKWQLPIAQNTLSGWMMLLGWIPLAVLAPFFDPQPLATELANLSTRGWFAIGYNIFLAGTLAHWAWFTLARTLPVAVSSLSSLPVPVVGVLSGMLVLGERPGAQEWIALALVVAALFTVLFQPSARRIDAAPLAPDD
ncbi:MAG TPA: EamA family transporter [Casimicrobiaceae bacterium]|nr:EamA family transporter [Casimicrobiaceae bacterium]